MTKTSIRHDGSWELEQAAPNLDAALMRVNQEKLVIRGYRYQLDRLCKQARFDELSETFGDGFQGTSIPTDDKSLHSVFTEKLRDDDGQLRHGELETLISYLQARI
jgi:hypothetical protein